MKHKVGSLIFLVIFGFFGLAQPPKGLGQSDPAAKKILDGVSAKFKTFKSIQANFKIVIENNVGKVIGTKTGIVYLKGTKDESLFSNKFLRQCSILKRKSND